MRVRRLHVIENVVAAAVLGVVVFLAYPTWAHSRGLFSAHCGCPEINKSGCEMPCAGCCDDPATPAVEPCPCNQENPTFHGH